MKRTVLILAFAAALASCGEPRPAGSTAAGGQSSTADNGAQSGRQLFSPCAVCHSVKEGEASRIGPNLYGIVGRTAGTESGFAYSNAMRDSGVVWTEENLDAFIENPQMFIRSNRMGYAGERDPDKRAAIIDYLKSLAAQTD